ncbi:MAG TPA: hypothetical protein VGC36_00105 [Rhizomicrobium sp.]
MRKGTLARFEIYLGATIFAAAIGLAGYGLVSALADRLDPKVRDCVERNLHAPGPAMTREYAVALCKRLEAMGGL